MDILSYVMGMNASKGSGGSSGGGGMKFKYKGATLTGDWNERVSIDFGFKPDFLVIFPEANVTVSDKNFLFTGCSQKFYDTFGYRGNDYYYMSSGVMKKRGQLTMIDGTNTDYFINNADETGFSFAISHASGEYKIYAFGLP